MIFYLDFFKLNFKANIQVTKPLNKEKESICILNNAALFFCLGICQIIIIDLYMARFCLNLKTVYFTIPPTLYIICLEGGYGVETGVVKYVVKYKQNLTIGCRYNSSTGKFFQREFFERKAIRVFLLF